MPDSSLKNEPANPLKNSSQKEEKIPPDSGQYMSNKYPGNSQDRNNLWSGDNDELLKGWTGL
ncbi:MAG: hypothetical protein AAFO04_21860 [Cyanobacteria bacterium J06592_8]